MPMPWLIPVNFDGAQFAARYNLQPADFWAESSPQGNLLYLRAGVINVPDPPILDVCPAPTAATKADTVPARGRVLAALALRASPTTWARLTIAEQNAAQNIIDNFAGQVLTAIRS